MANTNVESLSVKALFSKDTSYVIPSYQRNYAWEETQVKQLIRDVFDKFEEANTQHYYIGSLVVDIREKRDGYVKFETVDGQQRHTTLCVILAALKSHKVELDITSLNLNFECRVNSKSTLEYLFENGAKDENAFSTFEPNILNAFQVAHTYIKQLFKDEVEDIEKFADYLLKHVIIVRTCLPNKTDLNHYFEIMNNRGEQLESHEIIKARLMNVLSKNDHSAFSVIWDACSDMGHYAPFRFPSSIRNLIFGDDLKQLLLVNNKGSELFETVAQAMESIKSEQLIESNESSSLEEREKSPSLISLFEKAELKTITETESDIDDRFVSVINFPNFLLHVLNIHCSESVSLDDKKLITEFDKYLLRCDDNPVSQDDVKEFVSKLLKVRVLFDNYIIKRDLSTNTGGWGIRQLERNKSNSNYVIQPVSTFAQSSNNEREQLTMLQTMFHVSYPANNYKNWLSSILTYLNEQTEVTSYKLLERIEKLAFEHLCEITKMVSNSQVLDREKFKAAINCGTDVQSYIFNFLDYKIWQKVTFSEGNEWQRSLLGNTAQAHIDTEHLKLFRQAVSNFKFTSRSSVEHHYPQTSKIEPMDYTINNSFANLCLVSSNTNSSLGNASPDEKKQNVIAKHKSKAESLKQRLMFCYKDWYNHSHHKADDKESGIQLHAETILTFLLEHACDLS